ERTEVGEEAAASPGEGSVTPRRVPAESPDSRGRASIRASSDSARRSDSLARRLSRASRGHARRYPPATSPQATRKNARKSAKFGIVLQSSRGERRNQR